MEGDHSSVSMSASRQETVEVCHSARMSAMVTAGKKLELSILWGEATVMDAHGPGLKEKHTKTRYISYTH